MELNRLVISCGGTGGHFNPGLSVAREFKSKGGSVLLLLGGKHADNQAKTAAKHGIESVKFRAAPLSKSPLKLARFFLDTIHGIRTLLKTFHEFKPQALLAMGSYTGLSPAIVAKLTGVPLFLHDGNAKIGKSNRFFSRFAKAMALSFPAVNADECACPTILTGMPLRPEIAKGSIPKSEAVERVNTRWNMNFNPVNPLVLVFGGSLGADTINRNIIPDDSVKNADKIQFIRLTGPGKIDAVKRLYTAKAPELVLESCDEMNLLYSAADLIVCRSGGSTVSEIAIYGKFALLIPYPYAAEGHQDDNARWLTANGGAEAIPDSECSKERFSRFISEFTAHKTDYMCRGEASRKIAKPEAAANVVDMINNLISVISKTKNKGKE